MCARQSAKCVAWVRSRESHAWPTYEEDEAREAEDHAEQVPWTHTHSHGARQQAQERVRGALAAPGRPRGPAYRRHAHELLPIGPSNCCQFCSASLPTQSGPWGAIAAFDWSKRVGARLFSQSKRATIQRGAWCDCATPSRNLSTEMASSNFCGPRTQREQITLKMSSPRQARRSQSAGRQPSAGRAGEEEDAQTHPEAAAGSSLRARSPPSQQAGGCASPLPWNERADAPLALRVPARASNASRRRA